MIDDRFADIISGDEVTRVRAHALTRADVVTTGWDWECRRPEPSAGLVTSRVGPPLRRAEVRREQP